MAENSKIEWTDHTFNPWWGCQKVSPACDHCYAERDAKRFAPGRVLWGVGSERRTFEDKHWQAPHNWNQKAKDSNRKRAAYSLPPIRPRVFCASMADWLDLDAPLDQFVRLLDLIRLTPELDWLLLSKRIGNWRKRAQHAREHVALRPGHASDVALLVWIDEWLIDGRAPTNLWLGATVVNQAEADRDIPKLLQVPARVRFLSIEPMLGPIDLGLSNPCDHARRSCEEVGCWGALSWVIVGGESGPGARPMHPDWARGLRDQCAAAGVPFLFKQHGEWIGVPDLRRLKGGQCPGFGAFDHCQYDRWHEAVRVGKKAAGRQLDGRTHDEFPA